ncbi:MAG: CPBP family intramembrane metalloprotease [Defluviitaleaceae bacterium]|nr:CPBP family intramembrane metalloprotease [Defluviitaleaceae bacterium]
MITTLYLILLLLSVTYLVSGAYLTARRLKLAVSTAVPGTKVKRYVKSIIKAWIQTAAVLAIVLISDISFRDIGFRPLNPTDNMRSTVITFILCGALLTHMVIPIIKPIYGQKTVKKYGSGNALALPRNKKERLWWTAVSATAGITEEIIFRGFLFYLFFAIFPGIAPITVVFASGAIFGLCHMYQGTRGVVMTGAIGVGMGYLYIAAGSLIPVILLHFSIDIANVFMLPNEVSTRTA